MTTRQYTLILTSTRCIQKNHNQNDPQVILSGKMGFNPYTITPPPFANSTELYAMDWGRRCESSPDKFDFKVTSAGHRSQDNTRNS